MSERCSQFQGGQDKPGLDRREGRPSRAAEPEEEPTDGNNPEQGDSVAVLQDSEGSRRPVGVEFVQVPEMIREHGTMPDRQDKHPAEVTARGVRKCCSESFIKPSVKLAEPEVRSGLV